MKSPFKLSLLAATIVVALALPRAASAHMVLKYPPSRIVENAQGDPQKNGPCTAGTMTNKRTKFKPGQKVMVQWTETVHHAGHFRISFAENGTDVFKDPTSATDIVEPPTGAILKDGLFPDHKLKAPLEYEVTLPNVTCKTCTIQVIQVMLEGKDVSMYYHCADIELSDDAGGGADAGTPGGGADAGAGSGGSSGAGGSAATGGSSGTGGAASGTGGSSNSGGSTGSGGASATGGSTGGGSSSGGSTGSSSGGSSGNSGGSTGSGKGTGGSAPSTPPDSPPASCTMGSDRQPITGLGLLAIVGLALLRRRRRA